MAASNKLPTTNLQPAMSGGGLMFLYFLDII